jgi:hypothetical protein
LYRKFKDKYKKLKVIVAERDKELQTIKTQLKFTKVNEYSIQNKVLYEEVEKYKNLISKAEQVNLTQQQYFLIYDRYLESFLVEKRQLIKNIEDERNTLNQKIKELEGSKKSANVQNQVLSETLLQSQKNNDKIFPITGNYFAQSLFPFSVESFQVNFEPILQTKLE